MLRLLAAVVALLTDFKTLADLVSLGTLAVFWLVVNALVYRRCAPVRLAIRCSVMLLGSPA